MGGNTMYIMTYLEEEEKEMQIKLERKKGRTRQNTNRNIVSPGFLHFWLLHSYWGTENMWTLEAGLCNLFKVSPLLPR